MNFIKYTYLVAYTFKGGVGRTVVERNKRVNAYEDITGVEQSIADWGRLQNVGVSSFQLLNWRFVWPLGKEPEPVVEKQPEPPR